MPSPNGARDLFSELVADGYGCEPAGLWYARTYSHVTIEDLIDSGEMFGVAPVEKIVCHEINIKVLRKGITGAEV